MDASLVGWNGWEMKMKSLKAGVGKSDISPKASVEMCGYGPALERRSTIFVKNI